MSHAARTAPASDAHDPALNGIRAFLDASDHRDERDLQAMAAVADRAVARQHLQTPPERIVLNWLYEEHHRGERLDTYVPEPGATALTLPSAAANAATAPSQSTATAADGVDFPSLAVNRTPDTPEDRRDAESAATEMADTDAWPALTVAPARRDR